MPVGLGLGLGLGAPGGGEATPAPTVPVLIGSRGAFVLNGQAAELRATRKLVAEAGAFALTGNAAGARAARLVTAEAGSFALTGNAITLGTIQQYLDRMVVAPPTAVRSAIFAFLNGLWTDGVYQKLDAAWIMNLHTEQASRLNFMGPGYTLTDVGAAPTWVSGVGGAGGFTAAGAQLNTGFGVSVNGVNAVRDNIHLSLRSWTSALSTLQDIGHNSLLMSLRSTSDVMFHRCHSGTSDSEGGATDGAGFFAVDRSSAADYKVYKNGAVFVTETETSIAPVGAQIYVCGTNAANVSTRRQSFVSVGGSLGDAGQAALRARLMTFEAAIGAT